MLVVGRTKRITRVVSCSPYSSTQHLAARSRHGPPSLFSLKPLKDKDQHWNKESRKEKDDEEYKHNKHPHKHNHQRHFTPRKPGFRPENRDRPSNFNQHHNHHQKHPFGQKRPQEWNKTLDTMIKEAQKTTEGFKRSPGQQELEEIKKFESTWPDFDTSRKPDSRPKHRDNKPTNHHHNKPTNHHHHNKPTNQHNKPNIQTKFRNASGLVYRLEHRKRIWKQKFSGQSTKDLTTKGFKKLVLTAPVPVQPRKVVQPPRLNHGLHEVLKFPGVHSVESISSWLQKIHQPREIDYNALPSFVPPSQDEELFSLALGNDCKFVASTSSMTGAMSHIYMLFSRWKGNNVSSLPSFRSGRETSFAYSSSIPVTMMVRPKKEPKMGKTVYAIDSYKWHARKETILLDLGKSLEQMLTVSKRVFEETVLLSSLKEKVESKKSMEAFHYLKEGELLLRSQIDCHDPDLPRKVFDLKTRATRAIRTNLDEYQAYLDESKIHSVTGMTRSFEREYFDMIRSAFLKYIFQVRIGQMDGIFVAFHNTENIYGFEYIKLEEMERTIFETQEMADTSFKVCLRTFNEIVHHVMEKCHDDEGQNTLRITIGSKEQFKNPQHPNYKPSHLFVFVESVPTTVDQGWEDNPKGMVAVTKVRKFVVNLETSIDGMVTDEELLLDEGDDAEVWIRIEEATESTDTEIKNQFLNCNAEIWEAQELVEQAMAKSMDVDVDEEGELVKVSAKDLETSDVIKVFRSELDKKDYSDARSPVKKEKQKMKPATDGFDDDGDYAFFNDEEEDVVRKRGEE